MTRALRFLALSVVLALLTECAAILMSVAEMAVCQRRGW